MDNKTTPDFDLYATLGVDRSANTAGIRKAYRRRAKTVHPDANPGDDGAAAAFARLRLAHDVLTDEKRRAEYDATGSCDELGPDNALGDALALISQALIVAINSKVDLATMDVRARLVQDLNESLGELRKSLKEVSRRRARAELMMKRFVRKSGAENLVAPLLQKHVRTLAAVEAAEQALVIAHEQATALLADHPFTFEPGAPPQPDFGHQQAHAVDIVALMQGRHFRGWDGRR